MKSVKWTKRALKDLNKITVFNSELMGKEKAVKIAMEIIESPEILTNSKFDFEKLGSIDENFIHLKREYRKIFFKNYKITYRLGNSEIYITRVFDVRQNPNKNK